jgi:hypothetical protein
MRLVDLLAPSLVVFAIACSDSTSAPGHDFAGAPLISSTSASGALRVSLRSSPNPPARGIDVFELTVADGMGTPVDGLAIEVTPWMPSHGHGTSVAPTVSAQGGGVYVVDNVDLYMPGTWELRIVMHGGSLMPDGDHLEPSVDVP